MIETSLTLAMVSTPIVPQLSDSAFNNQSAVFGDVEGRCQDIWDKILPWSKSWDGILKTLEGRFLVTPRLDGDKSKCSFSYDFKGPLFDRGIKGIAMIEPFLEDGEKRTKWSFHVGDKQYYSMLSKDVNKKNTIPDYREILRQGRDKISISNEIPLLLGSRFPRFPWPYEELLGFLNTTQEANLNEFEELSWTTGKVNVEGKIRTGFFSNLEIHINCRGVEKDNWFDDVCTWSLNFGRDCSYKGSLDRNPRRTEINIEYGGEKGKNFKRIEL